MTPYTIHTGDCLDVMRDMSDNSVDAIVTDPPYFRVKDCSWDRQWAKPADFLAWFGDLAEQWQRLLRPNGSLYVFASDRMAARVETVIANRFSVLNQIVWVKTDGTPNDGGLWSRSCKEKHRAYFPQTERIIFAEHYGADNIAKGVAGYAAKCDELRGFVFEPLRKYLADEFAALGWNEAKLNEICGTASMAGRHYTARSQWCLPTAQHYAKLQAAANGHLRREYEDLRREYGHLRREYGHLRREYEDLRREYEDLRRPFSVAADVPYTDVWRFTTVAAYPGKHPCEKPVDLLAHIVNVSTRPGSTVLDCFSGSCSTGVACLMLGRQFIGIEQAPEWAEAGRVRLEVTASLPTGQTVPTFRRRLTAEDARMPLFAGVDV